MFILNCTVELYLLSVDRLGRHLEIFWRRLDVLGEKSGRLGFQKSEGKTSDLMAKPPENDGVQNGRQR